jgi:hypothetical protein
LAKVHCACISYSAFRIYVHVESCLNIVIGVCVLLQVAKADDVANCTFKPKLSRGSQEMKVAGVGAAMRTSTNCACSRYV